jgi:predicted acyltransferase
VSIATKKPVSSARQRLASIDAFRGLTVAFMILVNNGGEAPYAQLRHAEWNGCTLTDLVFPTFLFIMGVSASISFQSRIARGLTRGEIVRQVIRRSALIVLIGLILNALPIPHLATLRYCGVLQRIGVCYLIATLAILYLGTNGVVVVTAVLTVGYWLLMAKVPVPGFGWPGIDVPILDPHGNLASYLDRLLIPQAHRYRFDFYDPEGPLSTLPSIATTCLGLLTGSWIVRRDVPVQRKLIAMACVAILLIVTGLAWNAIFPLNKRLWTSSYVLFAGGIALALLTLFQWLVDAKRLLGRSLEPLLAFGGNALTAYIFSEVLAIMLDSIPAGGGSIQEFLYNLIPHAINPALRSLIWSILFVEVCWLPVFYLRRRGLVVKL